MPPFGLARTSLRLLRQIHERIWVAPQISELILILVKNVAHLVDPQVHGLLLHGDAIQFHHETLTLTFYS